MNQQPPVQASGRQKAATAGSDEKRERILRAAEALFDAQGYANTTIEQIVQQLGVTKPFVYYYFRNKLEIFETLSWAPTVACFTAMDFAEGDTRPAHVKVAEGIERLIRATLEHIHQGVGIFDAGGVLIGWNQRLADLLQSVPLGQRQLERLFRHQVGLTPKQFSRIQRVALVRRELRAGEALLDTALTCGYSDQAHFIHDFKTVVGMTPGQYRLRIKRSGA